MTFTPGDWYLVRHTNDGGCYRIDVRGNPIYHNNKIIASEPICSLYQGFIHFEDNAKLIEIAPKLLIVCRELVDACCNHPEHGVINVYSPLLPNVLEKARVLIGI